MKKIIEDKRGWIKVMEAFIAVVMLISMVLLIVNHEKYESVESSNLIEKESAFLRTIQTNESLRNDILALDTTSNSYEMNDSEFPENLRNYINETFSEVMVCDAKICNYNDDCFLGDYEREEVFSKSVIISSNKTLFSPKKLVIFCSALSRSLESLCEPEEEVCDGLDNDCDLLVDEGLDCEPVEEPETIITNCPEGETCYYISNSGNDSKDGLSPLTAWATLSKASNTNFNVGDHILLERGNTWRETLSIDSFGSSYDYINISNYGAGINPQILGSEQATNWSDQGNNIWMSSTSLSEPADNIWFVNTDKSIGTGTLKTSATMTSEYDWYWSSNHIYIYSTTNPSTKYSSVEVEQRTIGISANKRNYISVDGIDIHYTRIGVHSGQSDPTTAQSGMIVRNCEISYLGYPDGNGYGIYIPVSNSLVENNIIHDVGRRGLSISMHSSAITIENIIIRNNHFYNGYHTTGVDIIAAGGSTGTINNISIESNLIENTKATYDPIATPMLCYASEQSSTGATVSNIYYINNIFKYSFLPAISLDKVGDLFIYNNIFYGHNEIEDNPGSLFMGGNTNVKVKNNVFYSQLDYDTNNAGIAYFVTSSQDPSEIESDYNGYYRVSPTLEIIRVDSLSSSYDFEDQLYINSDLGWESNSLFGDPLFVSSSDFHLQSGSPFIDAGIDVGLPYEGSAPDLGAYESSGSIVEEVIENICPTGHTCYYISPTGSDSSGNGSIGSPWFTLNKAWSYVSAGDTIYMRGGTYEYDSYQNLRNKEGTEGNYINIFNYPGEKPVITRSSLYSRPASYHMISAETDYVHLKGLEITGVLHVLGEEEQLGQALMFTNSNYCIWENIDYNNNGAPAAIRGNSTGNLILNSDFHHNYDPWNTPAYGNADGLNLDYMPEDVENTVRGCRFWANSDDGLDLWENEGYVTIENSWSWENGYREDGVTAGGDGVGFKLGKTNGDYSTELKRTITNSLSFNNRLIGISQNGAYCKMNIYNNIFYGNYLGTYFSSAWGDQASIFRNNIAYANTDEEYHNSQPSQISDHNSWDSSVSVSDADFLSVVPTGVDGPRNADGSLPNIDFLRLASSSDMIDKGIDVGLPYEGSAPDLGAYEIN